MKGEGNQQDYGMRIYDPRLGKFLSVDPLAGDFAWNSTYAYAESDVIRCVDLDGLEKVAYMERNQATGWLDGLLKVPGNIIVDGGNGLAWLRNKDVDYYHAVGKADPVQGIIQQVSIDATAVKNDFAARWEYHSSTSVKTQLNDAWSFISEPDIFYSTLEQALMAETVLKKITAPKIAKRSAGLSRARLTEYAKGLGTERPYVISAVTYAKTGKIYFGGNKGITKIGDVHPELAKRLPKESLENGLSSIVQNAMHLTML